jgi:hypothetical protein
MNKDACKIEVEGAIQNISENYFGRFQYSSYVCYLLTDPFLLPFEVPF